MIELDNQMHQWSARLRDEVGLSSLETQQLASVIAGEVLALPTDSKQRVRDASLIPLENRVEELRAFQTWMDLVGQSRPHPAVVRAQVVTQIYICFVYLGEACFRVLRRELPGGSPTKKCCTFLTENPIRALRNAVAHSNWRYLERLLRPRVLGEERCRC